MSPLRLYARQVCTVLFVVDLFASFLTRYADTRSDWVVTDHGMIARRYLRGWFIIDFVAAAPLEVLVGGGAGFVAKVARARARRIEPSTRLAEPPMPQQPHRSGPKPLLVPPKMR
jgi:general stress protein CsbA